MATGKTTSLTWSNLSPGTYLIESGTHPSIQGPMGLYGVLVVKAPVGGTVSCPVASQRYQAYTNPATCYDADVPLVLSEIDPVQNTAVAAAVTTTGFSETLAWSGQPGGCGDSKSTAFGTCYPPTVNYDPRYYLINGVAFDRTNPGGSSFAATAPVATGQVLVRFVNAGLRMHVPSIVGAQTGNPVASGFSLIAEDGNVLPGNPRIQSEVFLAAGKTYDVMINAPATGATALPVYDRELSLSTNNQRDGGMQGYVAVNGGALPTAGAANQNAIANPDKYFLVAGNTLTVTDQAKGLIANDINVYGVQIKTPPTQGTLTLNPDGTFVYVPNAGATSDSFVYQANGNPAVSATVTLAACTAGNNCLSGPPVAGNGTYVSNIASRLQIGAPGVLANATDPKGLPLTAAISGAVAGGTVTLNPDGSFTAIPSTPPVGSAATATMTFHYTAKNSQNTSSTPATVTVTFKGGSGLAVTVKDPKNGVAISDYRWIIEEDRTFQIDPACQVNSTDPKVRPATCPPLPVQSLGTNFHSSYMPVVASGCVGTFACEFGQTLLGQPAVCDVGNGVCRTGAVQQTPVSPGQVALDPSKRYYISILPGDAGNSFSSGSGAPVDLGGGKSRPFSIDADCGPYSPTSSTWVPGSGTCGHTMGGAPIAAGSGPKAVTVAPQETPLPTAKIAVFVFQDDFPLNGENDAGGGVDALATQETGLGGFQITLNDQAGGFGDATGQPTYDMFNMPLSNSLAGTKDPRTGLDACPISKNPDGLVGMIVTCPHFESDGKTISPLEGQAVIANLYPGLYEVVATPGADRIGRGEEWLQTNTLDGTKGHEAFIKAGEPAYFQEFGPAGYHVSIGFANPKIINARLPDVCASATAHCANTVKGRVTMARISRSPDERLYSSGSYDAYGYTQCYVSLGDPDAEDFAFTKCNADGTFTFAGIPDGTWRVTVFDQWNDLLVDGLSVPVAVSGGNVDMGDVPMQQWRTNLYTRTFIDTHGDGVSHSDDPGLPLVPTNVRFRDGSYSNFNNTDLNGFAGFNEIFPYFNWLTLEADTTRFKQTGVHVVYDAGGPADGHGGGNSTIASGLANTLETNHLPTNLRIPGAVYCDNADCNGFSIKNGPGSSAANPSTGRIDPPWVTNEGWQGFIGNAEFVEFGKKPFATGENGGIKGEVIYASTRPFDDPALLLHTSWTPDVPNVTVNLYQEGTGPDGTPSLKLVDTTKTSSWDDWAQGFRSDGIPNMNCPGQDATSPFFFTLNGSKEWLNPGTALPNNSQFKCYDGMHAFNQVQPAPFDGKYIFPSIVDRDPRSGAPTGAGSVNGTPGSRPGSNCTICVANPDDGTPMLPAGKYVVEVVVPPGYELVKEEDKNILIGDNYIAPVTQQFAALGNIFILPDQAAVNSTYNRNNAQNPTSDLGSNTFPRNEGDTGSVETFWPCVGALRIVPDYISLFPGSKEVAPFAGASRHLCDRKEVTLADQMSVLAKFWIFSSTHVAAHFTGIITDDFASEFDPFSPQFGEKFAVPNLPVSFKDFNGNEVARYYSDQWGFFNGLNYSTWEVNPPNPTGYAPTMMITCMNDPGPVPDPLHPGQTMTDPLYNANYSQFCYEWAFMPGQTAYMDTPVIPTSAFADSYTPPDCKYPDATPAIAKVIGNDAIGAVAGASGTGPWVSGFGPGHTLTITARGDDTNVPNPAYSGPTATTAPFNRKFITRHYGFGATQGSGSVKIGGVPAFVTSWSDTQIQVIVPPLIGPASSCTIQQRGVLAPAMCGELVITAGNGKRSIDTVTVTIGGKRPTYVTPTSIVNSSGGAVSGVSAENAIQLAIDKATPGDLIIVGPGTYNEMLLMWKPVRLQGVGAASVTVNASAHPAGKIDSWRRQVNCLFGLSLNGGFISGSNPYDPNGSLTCSSTMQGKSDPIPLEPLVGWDPSLNGNLAELLQEPTLMGAYEGAAITVLGKGLRNANTPGVCDALNTTGCIPLNATTDCSAASPFFGSNFLCNPSRIDGMGFTNSSAGGGGVFLHGWNHSTEVSNNRIYSNSGTLSGGITVGQMETPDATIDANGRQIPFGYNMNVRVHHNSITQNSSIGDELNSVTPEAAGGVTMCTGADNYRFNYNWVCGNMSGGDGGGFSHFGFSANGNISDNWILFNQSFNPTIPTHGGGLSIMGAAPDGAVCENIAVDQDCAPQLSDGIGPNLVIDSNLIMGNSAESGSGGGLRMQSVNGSEVARNATTPANWYGVSVTNNIIANNVAGWDGGGVSLQDALRVSFINNTVVSNDTTASSGVLFNTLGAANANTPPPAAGSGNGSSCSPQPDPNQPQDPSCVNPVKTSTPQAAGLVAMRHTSNLIASLPATVTCPAGYPTATACRAVSYPMLQNDLFWQNRTFNITVGSFGPGLLNQQHLVTLVPTLSQTSTGNCPSGANYWDIGIRGDTGPSNHNSGFTLQPVNSILTSFSGSYSGNGNQVPSNPDLASQYCNGSRVPPENGGLGYNVAPGISDATLPNPVFNLTPAATVDEGNNWVNMAYGPLSLNNAAAYSSPGTLMPVLGNYSITTGSPAINNAKAAGAPNHDIFGTPRPQGVGYDIGAVEFPVLFGGTTDPLALGSQSGGLLGLLQQLAPTAAGNVNLPGGVPTLPALIH
ncbi:Ig-like domain-containing protein [Paraburkholderia madseniana]|uniref:Ig-like domain-containing protein n=1 Tax=Paraburkholderia madseniana TaxID=2599607 RepID=UPI0038B82BAD